MLDNFKFDFHTNKEIVAKVFLEQDINKNVKMLHQQHDCKTFRKFNSTAVLPTV